MGMCRRLIGILLLCLPLTLPAQEETTAQTAETTDAQQQHRFGYLNYSEVIRLMPEYASSQEKLNQLQEKYDAELQRSDREFNLKFAEFLEGQKEFPENILIKRQKELQDLMEKSIRFKNEVEELLETARKELTAPVVARLNEAIGQVGSEYKLDYVLNTDNNACPYINPAAGLDITEQVKAKLNIK